MADPFIGEIRAFGFNYAPVNWAACNGQIMGIGQFEALYTIIGTTYGGDGLATFGLPNLQNSAPMHWGAGAGLTPRVIGEVLGSQTVSLTVAATPPHAHTIQTAEAGAPAQETGTPSAATWLGNSIPGAAYSDVANPTLDLTLAPSAISTSGASQPHQNMQPVLAVNFCIALFGIYPARS